MWGSTGGLGRGSGGGFQAARHGSYRVGLSRSCGGGQVASTWRTEAALAAVRRRQPRLHWVQAAAHAADALHGHHVAALYSVQRAEAGIDSAVAQRAAGTVSAGHHDGAGAAAALATAQFAASEALLCWRVVQGWVRP